MSQESKEQTRSIIVCMFGSGSKMNAACMHMCWEHVWRHHQSQALKEQGSRALLFFCNS